jgi:hypothetical protein
MRRLVAFLVVLPALFLTGCRLQASQSLPPLAPEQDLTVKVIERITAGQTAVVTAGPIEVPDGTSATLLLQGSYGPRIITGEFQEGLATLPLSSSLTQQAGVVTLVVTTQGYSGSAKIIIEAGPPVEPVTPLVGARSIVADGEHWSMAVVVPFDQYNNPIADGTPVNIQALHPGNKLEQIKSEIAHLVGWGRVYSGTKKGRTIIAVTVDGVPGPEGALLEVPGPPIPFDLTASPPILPADGRLLTSLRTSILVDQFGNELLDGTQVTFLVEDDEGTIRLLPANTINGTAVTSLQAPLEPSIVTVTAHTFGVSSQPEQVVFGAAARDFPVQVTIDSEEGSIHMRAGPVLSNLGQYIPDGTPVLFSAISDDGVLHRASGEVERGYATAVLRLVELPSGSYDVRARAGDASGSAKFTITGDR